MPLYWIARVVCWCSSWGEKLVRWENTSRLVVENVPAAKRKKNYPRATIGMRVAKWADVIIIKWGKSMLMSTTPSFPVYKAWWNMTRSSKQHFDHLFIIYYITFDYKLIIIVNYVWLWIQSYEICIIKIKI